MASLITPIFDRTIADLERANFLLSKINDGGISSLTPEERQEWDSELRGRLTHHTLNRISNNMRYAREILMEVGYIVPPITSRGDWTMQDFPRESEVVKIKADMTALRNLAPPVSPPVPDITYPDYEKINNIERILFDISQATQWAGEVSYNAGAFYAYSGAGWYFGKATTIPLPEYPVIVTDILPIGMVGDIYVFQIQVISASLLGVQFEIISGELPEGLTLSGDGIISGRPMLTGVSDFTLRATNIAGSSEKEFQIIVKTINTALRAGGSFAYADLGLYFGG